MDEQKKPQLIEQTAKRYKAMALVGGFLLAITILLIVPLVPGFYRGEFDFGVRFFLGLVIGFVGCGILLVAKSLAWWHHG